MVQISIMVILSPFWRMWFIVVPEIVNAVSVLASSVKLLAVEAN